MGVPAWMLTHTVEVAAYRGWDDYAAPALVPCFVGEKLASGGPTGTDRVSYLTVVAALGVDCPAGSRIVLADGRRGYAEAVAQHDGKGIGGSGVTPDHTEIAVRVATTYGPPNGEDVQLTHSTQVRDSTGSARWTSTLTIIPGCAVRPLTATENDDGSRTTLIDTVEVVMPPGTAVTERDRMRVRGLLYQVQGRPEVLDTPMSDTLPGVRVIGKRVFDQ